MRGSRFLFQELHMLHRTLFAFPGGAIAAVVGLSVVAIAPLGAQISMPALTVEAAGVSTLPISAAEARYHVTAQEAILQSAITTRQARYPIDSMNAVVSETGAHWLAKLKAAPVDGIQLDPSAQVGVSARDEAYAKAQITRRLATPKLSFQGKAHTYMLAVQSFTNLRFPERLPTAESYMKALDAMGDSAAYWQYMGHASLVDVYYQMGRSADVIRHGVRAIQLVNVMPFNNRVVMFPSGSGVYFSTLDALTGKPNYKTTVAQLNAVLSESVVPSPALVALDSDYFYHGRYYKSSLDKYVEAGALLGNRSDPMISNYWINRPSSDSQSVSVTDGKIRVVEIGSYYCAPCLVALQGMQRIQTAFPDIEVMMMTGTLGFWANRLVEADEEVRQLTTYYRDTAKVTIPVGIWKGKKVSNDNGETVPEGGPTFAKYPLVGKPTIWILDGKGIIRRIFPGYSRDVETEIAKTVRFLQREVAGTTETPGTTETAAASGAGGTS
jgi:hypothetical protein